MSWNGVKKQSHEQEVKSWCEEMEIENYTINSKGEIDVNGNGVLRYQKFEELPYKFGTVNGNFDVDNCKNLISLKNCPNIVRGYFSCEGCTQLDSLEGCPKEIGGDFWGRSCKRKFTKEEVRSLSKFNRCLYL